MSCLCVESLWTCVLPYEDAFCLPRGGYRDLCFLCGGELGKECVITSGGIKREEPLDQLRGKLRRLRPAQAVLALWLIDEVEGCVARLIEAAARFSDEIILDVLSKRLNTEERVDRILCRVAKAR